jgi:hypothetical protein
MDSRIAIDASALSSLQTNSLNYFSRRWLMLRMSEQQQHYATVAITNKSHFLILEQPEMVAR